jgi:CubicO group peptidase (beta-lactamase class C family)
MSETTYESKLEELKTKGFRPVDIEVLGGTSRKYACIWRKNSDGRAWEVRTKLTDSEFSTKWEEMKTKGFRPIDQECHQAGGTTYFGAIWMKNTENLKWVSLRKLTSEEFAQKFDLYKAAYIPVDVDVYQIGGTTYYSVIWVENKNNLAWVEKRNIPQSDFGTQFDEYSGKGYRLYSTESYERNGQQEYATIWVKEPQARSWYARRDMDATNFHNWWLRYADLGYRLEDIEVYKVGNNTRYAGVWLENDNRVRWKFRQQVEQMVDNYFNKNVTAGMSIAISVNNEIQYMRGWGQQDMEAGKAAHANTVYRHGSVAKALAGTVAFRLKAKNKLDLSKKTRDYEPDLPSHHTHTVGQLLSNRGKVRHYNEGSDSLRTGTDQSYAWAIDACELFEDDPLVTDPYLYSTHGYTCAVAAMEKATGKTYTQLVEDELNIPFGLSTMRCEYLKPEIAERSLIYGVEGNGFKKLTPLSLSWKFGGGGTESSVVDLVKFGSQLLNGSILSKNNLTLMTTPPTTPANPYAYGWDTGTHSGQKVFFKSGRQAGACAHLRCYPDKKIVVALLSNTYGDTGALGDLAIDISALLIK